MRLFVATCVLLVLFHVDSNCQEKKIRSLGPFILGETKVQQLSEWARKEDKAMKVYDSQSDVDFAHTLNRDIVIECVFNKESPKNSPTEAMKTKDIRVFCITRFSIADFNFRDLWLKFLHDTLYSIHVLYAPKDFNEALEAKYGNPITNITESKTTCRMPGLPESQVTEVHYSYDWSHDNISAELYETQGYDKTCSPNWRRSFTLYSKDLEKSAFTLNQSAGSEINKERYKDKVKDL